MAYCFYIDYLGREICLEPREIAIWDAYSRKLISYSTFKKEAREILIDKGVSRGVWISVMMYILGLYESGQYYISPEELEIIEEEEEEIEEEEELLEEEEEALEKEIVVVEFTWYGRTEYCKKSGHHIVVECTVDGQFECLSDYFYDHEQNVRDTLATYLWLGFVSFLADDYVLIPQAETSEGFSKFDVVGTRTVDEVNRLYGNITDVKFYRGNQCGDTVRRLKYYEGELFSEMEVRLNEFIDTLERECGIRV